ncbi:MAG: TOBE domain-containing protein [Anaerolineae bacterium]|nr:MAG: TOBE domain-containing protein [Anaerolineae bacterium]
MRLVIRPEAIILNREDGPFEAVVRRATYLGSVIEYDIEVGGQLLIAVESDVQRATVARVGDRFPVGFHERSLYCLPPETG